MSPPDSSSEEEPGKTVARNSTLDAVVAVCLVVVGIVQIVEARRLGAEWTSDGPGSGYFPFYIGLILLVCGAAIFVQSLRARKTDDSVFVDSVQLKRVASVLVPSVIYVGAIMVLGIYVASAIYIAVFMRWLGKYPWPRSVAVGVGVSGVLFLMFEVWFKVPLFKGAYDPLAWLGF